MDNLNRSTIAYYVGEKFRSGILSTSKGVAIWLPINHREYTEMFPKFRRSRFYKNEKDGRAMSGWENFIRQLYQ